MRDGWTQTTLGETAQINPEKTPKWPDAHQIRYVDIASVNWGQPIAPDIERQAFGSAPGRARRRIRQGDVVVSTVRPNLRAMAVVPPELDGEVASTGFAVLRAREDIALPGFVWAVVSHESFRDDMVRKATGSNYPAVRPADVASHRVSLPPLDEQRRIVDLIGAVDDAMESADTQRAALDGLLVAELHNLGNSAASAPQTTLGDFLAGKGGSIQTGPFGTLLKASEYADSGAPVISTGEVRYGHIQLHEKTPRVGADVQKRLGQYLLRHGDVVFARKGAIDRSAWVKPEEDGYFLGSDGIRVRVGNADESLGIAHQIRTSRVAEHLTLNATGTIMKGLNTRVISSIPIGLIPTERQTTLSGQILAVENAMLALSLHITRLRVLRSNLLTLLLSGEHEIPSSYDALLGATA